MPGVKRVQEKERVQEQESITLNDRPSLPPLFTPVALTPTQDLRARAHELAQEGSGAGTLVYARTDERLEAAFLLEPETSLQDALPVAYVLMLGINDALGKVLPAQIGVSFRWPDQIYVNEACVGNLALASNTHDLSQEPDWLLAYVKIHILDQDDDQNPGRRALHTTLFEEGAGYVSSREILEALARFFVSWLHRWQDEGLTPLAAAWVGLARGSEEEETFDFFQGPQTGRVTGISERGDLLLSCGDKDIEAPLSMLLTRGPWAHGAERV